MIIWVMKIVFVYLSPSEGRQTENHNPRKLTNLITWITALSNSVKLWAMPFRDTQDGWVWWRVLTKCGPLEKEMGNHFSILALRTPWVVSAMLCSSKRFGGSSQLFQLSKSKLPIFHSLKLLIYFLGFDLLSCKMIKTMISLSYRWKS